MSLYWMAVSVVADIYLEIGERRCKIGYFGYFLQNGRNCGDSISEYKKDKAN